MITSIISLLLIMRIKPIPGSQLREDGHARRYRLDRGPRFPWDPRLSGQSWWRRSALREGDERDMLH